MPAPKDLIHETSTTTGTGNLTVAAVNGKVRFSNSTYGFGTGGTDAFDYFVSNRSAAEWERGTGHMSDADTLVRDTVIASTNSNAAVDFSAGVKDITNDIPAGMQINAGLLTTRGDIIYRGASVPERLAKGTQYQVLQAGANDPTYGALNLAQAAAVTGVLPAANLPDASTSAEGVSEFATAAEYRVGTDTARSLSVAEVWSAADDGTLDLVSSTYTVDFSLFASLATPSAAMAGNRTLGAPSNGKPGQHFIFRFTAATSTRTLTLHANYKLWDGVEAGPYSVTTTQTLYVCGFVSDTGAYEVTGIGRRTT